MTSPKSWSRLVHLLDLHRDATFIDTCLPSGSRHRNQHFQHINNAVHYALYCHGYCVINFIDDFACYDCLHNVLECLGLTISEKKLVPPKAVCLGILIDTVNGTVSMPDEKLRQINHTRLNGKGRTIVPSVSFSPY